MPGFLGTLEGIGSGLGQFAQQYQKQQQDALQAQILKLKIAEFMQQKQQQEQAAAAAWPAMLGGGGDTGAMPPIQPLPSASPAGGMGGGMGGAMPMPAAPSVPAYGAPVGGMARGGAAALSPQNLGDAAVAALPGVNFPTTANPNPPAPQWTGSPDPNMPPPGAPGAPPPANPPPTADGATPAASPVVAQAAQAAQAAQQITPPAVYGRMSLRGLASQIEKANPNADALVKVMALERVQKLLAPSEQRQWEMFRLEHDDKFKMLALQMREDQFRLSERRADITERNAGARLLETPEGLVEWHPGQPIPPGATTTKTAGGGLEASKTLEILDDKGNVLRTVLAREGKGKAGWVDSTTGAPIVLKSGESVRQITPSSAGGGRAGAQVLRQEIGGREVLSDLQNAVSLPVGQTIGMLGTVQPGTSVLGALQGDLVRKVTDQDAQLMQASMASMTRELSILMSPVYGGNWAAQQIDPLIPKSGDTMGTVIFKLARLAQSADNALEAVSKAPVLSGEQKAFAVDLRKQIEQAIPWTPAQAMAFAKQGTDPQESFADFVKRGGLKTKPGSPGAQGGGTKYTVGQIIDTPKGKVRVTGGDLNADPEVEPVQ